MNYYEQFYDDLEFCDPEDDPYRQPDPYYDRYYRDSVREYRDYYYERDRYERGYDESRVPHGHAPTDDPRFQESEWSRGVFRGHGSGSRGRGHPEQGFGRGVDRGRGRGEGHFNSERGRGRGSYRGGMKGMTFVKAGESCKENGSGENKNNVEGTGNLNSETADQKERQSKSDQIRFDYKKFQNDQSQTEKEVEQALKAYRCQLGFGYGYGPRTDLIEGEQPEWLIKPEAVPEPVLSQPETVGSTVAPVVAEKTPPQNVVKKAVVSPSFNFVKAKSEFHSIDVAFHEDGKVEEKPKENSLSVNFGNKRVGLGFGVSASKANALAEEVAAKFHAGMKNGQNSQIDAKFAKLQETVKAKTLPNKNGIEIIHMAVDKVKMSIVDDIGPGGRTPTGQPMFKCVLLIDGVTISQGVATAKKAAKHEAYQNGLKLFNSEALTVKETSTGVLELQPKENKIDFKVPTPIGPALGTKPINSKPTYIPAQKSQTGSSQTAQTTAQSKSVSTPSTTSQASIVTYSKPKMVFHQPSHPLNNKPLEFKSAESLQTGSQKTISNPEAMAIKLLNFVKEGSNVENQSQLSSSTSSYTSTNSKGGSNDRTAGNSFPSTSCTQSNRKRPYGQTPSSDHGQLKVQRKGKNVNHSIDDLSQFILIDSSPIASNITALGILHNSANFNRVVLKVEYETDDKKGDVRCSLVLSDIVVAIAHGQTKDDAKADAAVEALNYLKECCYTIKVKQHVDSDATGLTKEQLLSDIAKASEGQGGDDNIIPDSNIGNMMLRKMGWVGGGVGKDGKGIAEPVKTTVIIGRQGLGLDTQQGTGGNFKKRVTKMLEDYIKNDDQSDLHFSSELTKEERAAIHTIGQKMGLKTHSVGRNENRYLIVSRKRSAQQLLEHVRSYGGSTSRYELIPPNDRDLDVTRREDIFHGHCKM